MKTEESEFTVQKICEIIGINVPPNAENVKITGLADIENAGPGDLTFISNPKYKQYVVSTKAEAVIHHHDTVVPERLISLAVDDPYFAFLSILELFNNRTPQDIAEGIHSSAVIDPGAVVGENVSIGACASIGPGVSIGDGTTIGPGSVILKNSSIGQNCILYPNVTIMDSCKIGDRVILHAGVVIGSDGFGFVPHEGCLHKIPQIGTVVIGDDVEIGSNSCIDRAAFGATVVEDGTKIDNLVQLAHNVRIGKHTVIASQTGISGSTTIGGGVKVGGQAGFAGHLNIGNGSSVGAQAGVTKDVPDGETVSGYPAKNHMKAMRLEAALRSLPDLIKKIKKLENILLKQENKSRS
ncbi:UDP-3-O-(3-hydroxymyristoyl)glucosamine N-acyltransferase [Candidatus Latescibacterota bacterium]